MPGEGQEVPEGVVPAEGQEQESGDVTNFAQLDKLTPPDPATFREKSDQLRKDTEQILADLKSGKLKLGAPRDSSPMHHYPLLYFPSTEASDPKSFWNQMKAMAGNILTKAGWTTSEQSKLPPPGKLPPPSTPTLPPTAK